MKVFKTALISTFIIAQLCIALPAFADGSTTPGTTQGDKTQQNSQQGAQNSTNDGSAVTPETETENNQQPGGTVDPTNPTNPTNPTSPTNPTGEVTPVPDVQSVKTNDQLVLMMNSNKMYRNGQEVLALQPLTVTKGISYIALRSIAEQAGFIVKYDAVTKETILKSGQQEVRFKTNSAAYTINGKSYKASGNAYQQKDVFMVPLTSITKALNISYSVDNVAKKITLNLYSAPTANFTVSPAEIFAEQTSVTYKDQSSDPRGLEIVQHRWEGNENIFMEPGTHTITHWVMNANGVWSEPYSVTIEVKPKNLPPVAMFTTDKDTYKMGELITFTDESTDDENDFKTEWVNKSIGYFEPGEKTITIRATDRLGQVSEYSKTITITNETLYLHDEFLKLYTPVGEKFTLEKNNILDLTKAPFSSTDSQQTLLRSNSPESLSTEGIVFRDTIQGEARFLVHHKNISNQNLKVYVVVTNPGTMPTNVTVKDVGFAGPNEYESLTGKSSVERYFKSLNSGSLGQTTTLQPGETKVIFTELSAQAMKPGHVVSLMGDVSSDSEVTYQVAAVASNKDILKTLPSLTLLNRDNIHIRGTYENANRLIELNQVIGDKPSRISLADNNDDLYLNGIDNTNGMPSINMGNYGVMYTIRLNHVAPNTLIAFNPRGGIYKGIFVVNGQMTEAPSNGTLVNSNDASVVYRTGSAEESVTILFTPVSGSNLPVSMLFFPLAQQPQS
ncbi:stalk domain-containing protein [Paenibacillus terrigena]|uniref:stalk domain-containing protein n=1 Tax=Paenibacillus terrigena TaxID=369333 RepID=UPI0028D5B14D|nr:stalk domain-containing protein [Paenibacillus terrigena]